MVSLQIISRILNTKDLSIIQNNFLTKEFFIDYEPEYDFIMSHYEKYGNTPDISSFLNQFPNFEILEVTESENYLVDTIREEHLYQKTAEILQETVKYLETNSNDAVEYLMSRLIDLKPDYNIQYEDIVGNAHKRLDKFLIPEDKLYIETGFKELDEIISGWNLGEELVVIFGRTGQGKSYFLIKTLVHAWEKGERIGFISPEMSALKVGYRVDTILGNFSNSGLVRQNKYKVDENAYEKYIKGIKGKEGFLVTVPRDFNNKITISKIRNFVSSNKLTVLGIDGITYLFDERGKKNDNKSTSLGNISEDLMNLSLDLKIPILIAVQSNRGGIRKEEGTPDIENIRDSDGIAFNASKIISLKQEKNILEMGIKKNREGRTGDKLIYNWYPDTGIFEINSDEPEPVLKKDKEKTYAF